MTCECEKQSYRDYFGVVTDIVNKDTPISELKISDQDIRAAAKYRLTDGSLHDTLKCIEDDIERLERQMEKLISMQINMYRYIKKLFGDDGK